MPRPPPRRLASHSTLPPSLSSPRAHHAPDAAALRRAASSILPPHHGLPGMQAPVTACTTTHLSWSTLSCCRGWRSCATAGPRRHRHRQQTLRRPRTGLQQLRNCATSKFSLAETFVSRYMRHGRGRGTVFGPVVVSPASSFLSGMDLVEWSCTCGVELYGLWRTAGGLCTCRYMVDGVLHVCSLLLLQY